MDVETKPLWTIQREAMGKPWQIELWPDDAHMTRGGSELGYVRHQRQLIRVNANQGMASRDETMLHELLHATADLVEFPIREKDIGALSSVLFAFLRGFGLWRDFPWPDREEQP